MFIYKSGLQTFGFQALILGFFCLRERSLRLYQFTCTFGYCAHIAGVRAIALVNIAPGAVRVVVGRSR